MGIINRIILLHHIHGFSDIFLGIIDGESVGRSAAKRAQENEFFGQQSIRADQGLFRFLGPVRRDRRSDNIPDHLSLGFSGFCRDENGLALTAINPVNESGPASV